MANRITIRHGNSTPTTSDLLPYELGWDGTNLVLYINNNGTCKSIGGEGAFLSLNGGALNGRIEVCNDQIDPGIYPSLSTIVLRESKRLGTDSSLPHSVQNAPRLGFHWGDRYYGQLVLYNEAFGFYNWGLNDYMPVYASTFYGNLSGNATTSSAVISPYYYPSDVMTQSITSDTLFGTDANINKMYAGFMENGPFGGYADVINFTGYCKWGGTELAVEYNTDTPRLAIRKYVQSKNGWGDWNEFASTNALSSYVLKAGDTMNGTLHFKNITTSNYTEGIRLHPSTGGWNAIIFCGTDNTGDSGTSTNTWGIFTNAGNFYIGKNGSSNAATYLYNVSGNWLINNLTVGSSSAISSSSHSLWNTGITVHDTRYDTIATNSLSKSANFFFSNNNMPDNNWWAGIHVAGWVSEYNTWELVGSADASDQRKTSLCIRCGRATEGWGSWRAIITANDTTSRRIFVTTTATKPDDAVTGDIVLVKVT